MSTARDNVANKPISLPGGGQAVPNGDGTYTVSGFTGEDAENNGIWETVPAGTPGAYQGSDLGLTGEFANQWFDKI